MRTNTAAKPASEKQVAFIHKLLGEKNLTDTPFEGWVGNLPDGIPSRDASSVIGYLLKLPRRATPQTEPTAEVTEDGMYQDPTSKTVYKVQIAKQGSGRLYAKKLVITEEEPDTDRDEDDQDDQSVWSGSFEYAPGAIRTIRPEWKMTREQAAEFGKLYGICCVCGADLTDETSIAQGIGPICGKRF